MTEVTKQDVVAFRNRLMTQVSARTVNHDLKALKMLFKSARRDGVITEDPTEFVESVRRERAPKIKRPFTLAELRSILDLASDEWRSMIPFWTLLRPATRRCRNSTMEQCRFAAQRAAALNPKDREDDNSSARGTASEARYILACRRRSMRPYAPESF